MRWEAGRAARRASSIAALLVAAAAGPAAAVDYHLDGLVSLRLLATDGDRSYLDGGLGKLRLAGDDEPLALGAALLGYEARLLPTLSLRAQASGYDRVDRAVDLDEAYLEWAPVPRSAWRWSARGGAFHAPFSLEHSGRGWTSPYALSASAIGTWLGEELRTVGVQGQAARGGALASSPHEVSALAGVFQANDPAGALLVWRGWALHDRPTRLFERLPLAPLPIFTDTGLPQGAFEEPFVEIDGRTGWYAGVQWDYLQRSRLRLQRYDNNGDPLQVEDGQWAWDTRFDQLAWHGRLPRRVEVLAQAMRGSTRMDGFSGPLVDADFTAAYLLLSRVWGRQRLTLRWDGFRVEDRDTFALDPNDEDGDAWTAAWFLTQRSERDVAPRWPGSWRLGVELQRVRSDRPARRLLDLPAARDEESLQVALEWRY